MVTLVNLDQPSLLCRELFHSFGSLLSSPPPHGHARQPGPTLLALSRTLSQLWKPAFFSSSSWSRSSTWTNPPCSVANSFTALEACFLLLLLMVTLVNLDQPSLLCRELFHSFGSL